MIEIDVKFVLHHSILKIHLLAVIFPENSCKFYFKSITMHIIMRVREHNYTKYSNCMSVWSLLRKVLRFIK